MRAKRENKVYQVKTDAEKQRYLNMGYDIYGEDGKLLEYSPLKKIAYSEYAKLQKENEVLKAENAKLKKEAKAVKAGE